MQSEKGIIKKWLKGIGKDREWLAAKCLVSKMAVDQWFKKVGVIPTAKLALIKTLMDDPELGHSSSVEKAELSTLPDLDSRGKMFLLLDEEAQKKVFAEADRLNMDSSAYCTLAVEWCCNQPNIGRILRDMLEEKNRPTLKAAELAASYDSEDAKKNPPGGKSAGKDGAHGNIPKSCLSPERRYLRAAKLDESETA